MHLSKPVTALAIIILPLVSCTVVKGQLIGTWEVTRVLVGNTVKTPDAKWTKFEDDSTVKTGNGWLQHSVHTYKYDSLQQQLYLNDDIKDDYGPFNITLNDSSMTWKRMEDGYAVKVELKKVNTLPKSVADKIRGLWKLKKAYRDSIDITNKTDPEDKQYIFLRWDRRFIQKYTTKGQRAGYWYVNPHYPDITLINEQEHAKNTEWRVSFSGNYMTWEGINENKAEKRVFKQMQQFPE